MLSIAVHDVSREGGAFYFAGLQGMYSCESDTPPALYHPDEFDKFFAFEACTGSVNMHAGDMLLWDPLGMPEHRT